MYAVIKTGGKQHRVTEGECLRVEKLAADIDSMVTFDQVLLVGEGEDITIGAPLVDGASVTATIRSHGRADKVRIVKFRRRKHYKRQQGHRQYYTEVEIIGIAAGKQAATTESSAAEPPVAVEAAPKKTAAKKTAAKQTASSQAGE